VSICLIQGIRLRAIAFALAAGLVVAGCGEPEIQTTPITVTGTITAPDGIDTGGVVHIGLYHAWALDGPLRHPVEHIESFETAVGRFQVEADYPLDAGDGLLVYAWLDNDGDGILCTPADRNDLAGLVEVESFPAERVDVQLVLTAPCAGPDWFFPAAIKD
jgi:hypothetical protein